MSKKRVFIYPYLKFKKVKEKWDEIYYVCYCRRNKYLRGWIRKYADGVSWHFRPSPHNLFPAEFCHDLGNFLDKLNEDKDND